MFGLGLACAADASSKGCVIAGVEHWTTYTCWKWNVQVYFSIQSRYNCTKRTCATFTVAINLRKELYLILCLRERVHEVYLFLATERASAVLYGCHTCICTPHSPQRVLVSKAAASNGVFAFDMLLLLLRSMCGTEAYYT